MCVRVCVCVCVCPVVCVCRCLLEHEHLATGASSSSCCSSCFLVSLLMYILLVPVFVTNINLRNICLFLYRLCTTLAFPLPEVSRYPFRNAACIIHESFVRSSHMFNDSLHMCKIRKNLSLYFASFAYFSLMCVIHIIIIT